VNLSRFNCLSFDCYGTLIDWETGLIDALRPVLKRHGVQATDRQLLEEFAEAESAAERGPYRRYKEILRQVLRSLGEVFGFSPTPEEETSFSLSVRHWPAFDDSAEALKALQARYRLIVLSNIDDDLFRHSEERLGVKFHQVFTAERIGSYKPSERNFRFLLEHAGVRRSEILHVAQSLYHDIGPAGRLGICTVWVNRRHGRIGSGATPIADARPDLEVPDLTSLVESLNIIESDASRR